VLNADALLMATVAHKLPDSIRRAANAFADGRSDEAERLCRDVLRTEADHFDATYLLGIVLAGMGRTDEALAFLDKALEAQPENAELHYNRGNALKDLKRFEPAVAAYDRALALRPDYVDALANRGIALRELKKYPEALASLDGALALKPDYAAALHNRGRALMDMNRFDEALASYDRALAVRPDYPDALSNRGNALQKLKRLEEAMASYDRALALRPDYAEAFNNRGLALMELRRFDKALTDFTRALEIKPDYAAALANRGNALNALKRHEEALASLDSALKLRPDYDLAHNIRGIVLKELRRLDESLESYNRAIVLRPDFAEAYNNRGNILQQLRRPEEALASYDRALALRPEYAEAYSNRANTMMQLRRPENALADYARAIAIRPDYVEAHFNEAVCRLTIGDFARGWEKYEWRWETEQLRNTKRNISQPLWLGRNKIAGKTILLHAEQGYGDTIQFCRYVRLVAEQGADVILHVQPALRRLLSETAGARSVFSHGETPPPFDFHAPLMSLPLALGTRLNTIPPCDYRLNVPGQLMRQWEEKLGPKTLPRVGIAWSGQSVHKNDHNRSLSLKLLLGLLNLPIQIVSLQKEVRDDDQTVLDVHKADIAHFGTELTDFSDTAVLASLMDVVVSVDTSVAHLAGALDRPTWIMLPYTPDWRWLLDRDDSPWYPSVRLFRQASPGDWDDVIARVRRELEIFAICGVVPKGV
jgi:tetratricopeptide (TPR) repeat protein